jgi:uncharacterized SAM-binding protein YcdF (DUF218 family)
MTIENKLTTPFNLNKYFRFVIIFLSVTTILWFFGLLNFIQIIPTKLTNEDPVSDAIVVLTGGSDRLKQGLQLLSKKKASKLLVSGVYRGNDVKRLLQVQQYNPSEVLCCISLGYAATSTEGNAIETADWIKRNSFNSITLVTASYHMPRSLMLFKHNMPEVKIIAHPVFPPQFKLEQWWTKSRTASLIISEYLKYTVVSIKIWFEPLWADPNHMSVAK